MKSLKYIRRAIQIISLLLILALFLDFTGTVQPIFGFMARVQLFPAFMALAVVTVVVTLLATLVFGRLYCSVVCPTGIFQDVFEWIGSRFRPNRHHYRPENRWLRFVVLALFAAGCLMGMTSVAALIEPYSLFGRMARELGAPLYRWLNNVAAGYAEAHDSVAFYAVENRIGSGLTLGVAIASFVVIAALSAVYGRWWCSSICPVGTVLSLVGRFSLLRPVIDTNRCNGCRVCARRCKASCINPATHTIDMANCVVCFDCINNCRQGAISYKPRFSLSRKSATQAPATGPSDPGRRAFIAGLTAVGAAAATDVAARRVAKTVDGGLALIEDKRPPRRAVPLTPAGSWSADHFHQHCTGCQLCVANCPNGVLRPATSIDRFMQPQMGYERGHCRPECTRCADVCPTSAIRPITRAEKSSIQIGHAVWIAENCIVLTDGVECGACSRHCPAGAISMVRHDGRLIPAVDTERCIGCGACEHLCPARPFSAIYVEGHRDHRTI